MKNYVDIHTIEKIAHALGELNSQVVFVGGSVVGLYANDKAANAPRPTNDIDITLQIATVGKLEILRENLVAKGFKQKINEDVICRFEYQGIMVDVMSTKAVGWAPANRWFEPGFNHIIQMHLTKQDIQLLSLPYFLATKFDAYNDRGSTVARTSKDFEDIVYLMDNITNFEEHIVSSPTDVKAYLIQEFRDILQNELKQEAILGHMYYEIQVQRFNIIMDKIRHIVSSAF